MSTPKYYSSVPSAPLNSVRKISFFVVSKRSLLGIKIRYTGEALSELNFYARILWEVENSLLSGDYRSWDKLKHFAVYYVINAVSG